MGQNSPYKKQTTSSVLLISKGISFPTEAATFEVKFASGSGYYQLLSRQSVVCMILFKQFVSYST